MKTWKIILISLGLIFGICMIFFSSMLINSSIGNSDQKTALPLYGFWCGFSCFLTLGCLIWGAVDLYISSKNPLNKFDDKAYEDERYKNKKFSSKGYSPMMLPKINKNKNKNYKGKK